MIKNYYINIAVQGWIFYLKTYRAISSAKLDVNSDFELQEQIALFIYSE